MIGLIVFFYLNSLQAQRIPYDENLMGDFVKYPIYHTSICYEADSMGHKIRDIFGRNFHAFGDSTDLQWDYINTAKQGNNYYYFETRLFYHLNYLLSKHIQAVKNPNQLLINSNVWDSAYIFYTYDSSSGRYQYKTILSQLVRPNQKAINHNLKKYYYDTD